MCRLLLLQQLLLEGQLCAIGTEEEAVRQNDGGTAVALQTVQNHGHEEVGRFAAAQIRRKVGLDAFQFVAAVGGIHDDDVKAVGVFIILNAAFQRVAVADIGVVDVVEEQVRHAQQIGQSFFFAAVQGGVELRLVVRAVDLPLQFLEHGGKKAARTAGKVGYALA